MAIQFLYPPRCPLCDKILPARSALEWVDRPAADRREGAFPEIHPARSALEWVDRPAADRREGAFPEIHPNGRKLVSLICDDCRKNLPWVGEPACMKCGKPVGNPGKEFCEDCERVRHLFDCGRAAFTYTGEMRKSVYRMKAKNRRDYLDFYAEAMVRAGKHDLRIWQPEVIVPIPMHWRKRAARGYNQSELLARRISCLTGIPCEEKLLRCVRYTGNQKELSREERRENLRDSFEVESYTSLSGGRTGVLGTFGYGCACSQQESVMPCRLPSRVLLIDDVYTTGSTMDEAARALRVAGVRQIYFLVLCTGKGKKSLHGMKSVLY